MSEKGKTEQPVIIKTLQQEIKACASSMMIYHLRLKKGISINPNIGKKAGLWQCAFRQCGIQQTEATKTHDVPEPTADWFN